MDYRLSDQLVFITASPGAGGHRLGRIVSCFEGVHWDRCRLNGGTPWSTHLEAAVKGKGISPYHYDRRTPVGMVPLVGERIERYWAPADWEHYYSVVWPQLMERSGARTILEAGHKLTWVLHDLPDHLHALFPNARIINLVDADLDSLIQRYLETTAHFPAWVDNVSDKPDYETPHSRSLRLLRSLNDYPTERDFWCWRNVGAPRYGPHLADSYRVAVQEELETMFVLRRLPGPGWTNVDWRDLDLEDIAQELGSQAWNPSVQRLLDV